MDDHANGLELNGSRALSAREMEIARLISRGLPNKTIARTLELSPSTVSSHLKRIFLKLGVRSRTELAVWFVSCRDAEEVWLDLPRNSREGQLKRAVLRRTTTAVLFFHYCRIGNDIIDRLSLTW